MDVTRITDRLFISALLKAEYAHELRARDVQLIINMIPFRPPGVYRRPPFRTLNLPTIDSPLTPIPMRFLRTGVDSALPVIERGASVLAYCRGGRHRSVAMGACILIGLGYSSEEAMRVISECRETADPYAWHIQRRIRKFERAWRDQGPR